MRKILSFMQSSDQDIVYKLISCAKFGFTQNIYLDIVRNSLEENDD